MYGWYLPSSPLVSSPTSPSTGLLEGATSLLRRIVSFVGIEVIAIVKSSLSRTVLRVGVGVGWLGLRLAQRNIFRRSRRRPRNVSLVGDGLKNIVEENFRIYTPEVRS